MEYILIFLCGLLAGGINSIAGGGIFAVIPALIYSGLSGKQANATGSMTVWLGQFSSLIQNRKIIPLKSKLLRKIIGFGFVGSIIGGLLLIYTPNIDFEHALPYLNLAATMIFMAGPYLRRQRRSKQLPVWLVSLFLLLAGIYGGYFGGGLGLLMLAMLGMSEITDLRQQNAAKLLAMNVINLTSIILVVFANLVVWPFALAGGSGAWIGGFLGAKLSSKLPVRSIRLLVILIGLCSTIYLFIRF